MTISVTADAAASPPSMTVDLSVPLGGSMQSVALYRLDSGVRVPVRDQPAAGFDSRSVIDVEAPYGVPVSYSWDVSYVVPDAIAAVWVEAWASLAAWTVVGASWNVSGGALVWSGADSESASVSRAVTPGRYQVVLAAPPVGISRVDFGGFYIDVRGGRLVAGGRSAAFVAGTGPWTIVVAEDSVSLVTSAGTVSVPGSVLMTQAAFQGAMSVIEWASAFILPSGSGAGQFGARLDGFAVHPASGNVFISDASNGRIQVWTSAGVYVTSFGSTGTGNGQFVYGRFVIAFDAAGNVFVANNGRIQKFVPSGGTWVYSAKVGSPGAGDGQFGDSIKGLAVDSTGNVWASDMANNRVQKFTNALVYSSKFGSAGGTDGTFTGPGPIVVDSAGNVIVADLMRVQVFNSAGVFQRLLAPQGTTPGSLFYPKYGMAVQGDVVWVISIPSTDVRTQARLQKYRADGTYLGMIDNIGVGGTIDESNELAVAALASGDVLVLDALERRVTRYQQIKARIDDVTLNEFGPLVTVTETSEPVTLNVVDAWLVHPGKPGLSFRLSETDGNKSGVVSLGQISNETTTTIHHILGSDLPIATSAGNRLEDTLSAQLITTSRSDELALKDLLKDQTPILVRVPPSWGIDFTDGFYAVGTVTRERSAQMPDFPRVIHTLPLTMTGSPIVSVESSGWSFAAVAIEFESFDEMLAAFDSFAALTVNSR